ncbi:MAG: NAD-dependent protein deacetylase [Candidatus Binatia bacterium]|nr:MAG: NAD-dependent protein deacetylase [Candidatus Binatia bacterium]
MVADPFDRAVRLLARARSCVALTGAGASTESGIPDFRSPGGVWERFRPVTYQEFLASEEARREHWRYKAATVPEMLRARPNPAHEALATLEREGRLLAVLTQNIDGLHQKAGSRRVVELHGTNRETECVRCRRRDPIEDALRRWERENEVPTCLSCGGWLKPATISFGQALRPEVLDEAVRLAREADCFLAVGSSLLVQPAASLPLLAKEAGASLVIVNLTETPVDPVADVVLRGRVGEIVPRLVARALAEARVSEEREPE